MRTLRPLPILAVLALATAPNAMAQVTYPEFVLQNGTWTTDTHHFTVTNRILSPAVAAQPLDISTDADAEFTSATQVHLTDGFHAGGFSNGGHFRAHIAGGQPDDIVAIAPDPATHVVDHVLHVEKWEKFEIGLRLPPDYQDAVDRFFAHYYTHGPDSVATPWLVNAAHDLNPYADDSLQLVMRLTSPSGAQRMKWGFFMREARWSSTDPTAYIVENDTGAMHDYFIRFRFAPDTEGVWRLDLSLEAPHTSTLTNTALPQRHYTGYSFVCDLPLPDNKGYLHVNTANRRTLQFDTGEPFFGLGTNLADLATGTDTARFLWRDLTLLQTALRQLHSVGGNYVRMFFMANSFTPERVNLGVFDRFFLPHDPSCDASHAVFGHGQYQSWSFDQVLDSARANNIYIQMCVDPYPPVYFDEANGWIGDAYAQHYLFPARDNVTGRFDLKRYFYTPDGNGNPQHDAGVFYHWKRKYKYLMARYGFSVNIAAIEPFNEIDQLLTYQYHDATYYTGSHFCPAEGLIWPVDSTIPATVSDWVGDIADFVRAPVDTADPAHSPLGEHNKLFLMSYTDAHNPQDTSFYKPFSNHKVDVNDVHHGMYDSADGLSTSFDLSQDFRDQYHPGGNKKPFHNGEFSFAMGMDVDGALSHVQDNFDVGRIFRNEDIAFHNEIWASAFYGNFASGTTYGWPPIYWWEAQMPHAYPPNYPGDGYFIPRDLSNLFISNGIHSPHLNAWNKLDIGLADAINVQNKPCYHNFKPLADLLARPNWLALGFFDHDFSAHRVFNDTTGIECYFLLNEPDHNVAIGWVHNVNATWHHQFYAKKQLQYFLDCTAPSAQTITLPGFAVDPSYFITYFPTRMGATEHPDDDEDDHGDGNVRLRFDVPATAALNDTAYFLNPFSNTLEPYLDTLHADYAFIVAPAYHVRHLVVHEDNGTDSTGWDLVVYPNPSHGEVYLRCPTDAPKEVTVYDLTGRRVYAASGVMGFTHRIPLAGVATGPLCVRVSSGTSTRSKTFILH